MKHTAKVQRWYTVIMVRPTDTEIMVVLYQYYIDNDHVNIKSRGSRE